MADTGKPDDTDDNPSLEMPSFSLRRRRKAPPEPAGSTEQSAPNPPVEPVEPVRPVEAARPIAPVAPAQPVRAVPPAAAATAMAPEAQTEAEPQARKPRQLPTITLSGLPAAAATGVVVGALAVALSWVATSTCDVVRGTSSCGGGPGLVILLGVLVVLAYAGSLLLRVFAVADAGSTSVLAVGILAVLVLVFLLGSIDSGWMVVAIPVAAVAAFCASWWVTTSVVDEA